MAALRSKQLVAAQALLMGKSEQEAADLAGVTVPCLRKWAYKPAWTEYMAKEQEAYGLTDEQLAQRTKRAVLVRSEKSVERIEAMAKDGVIERNRLYADMFLVKTAVGKVADTPGGGAVPADLVKQLIQALVHERERGPRNITPAPVTLPAQ